MTSPGRGGRISALVLLGSTGDETVFLFGVLVLALVIVLFSDDKPLPYRWCTTHIDQELTEYGYCPLCKKVYEYGKIR